MRVEQQNQILEALQQEVLEICLDLLEMCIFMDSVRRRFFVPCVHWSYLE